MYYPSEPYSQEGLQLRRVNANIYGIYQPLDKDRRQWLHMRRVADMAQTHSETVVALCHDVVEDGHATSRMLHQWGLSRDEIQAVSLLTRTGKTYVDYIRHIINNAQSGSPAGQLAVRVKLYDLFDHIHPDRINGIDFSHVCRYTSAIDLIAQELWRGNEHERQVQSYEAVAGIGEETSSACGGSDSSGTTDDDEVVAQRESDGGSLTGEDAVPSAS